MNFNEVMNKLSNAQDEFGDFEVTYVSIDSEKNGEIANFSDNSVGMKNSDDRTPITSIAVEHEISYEKPVEVETIGDLKRVLENIDDDYEVIDVCLFAKSKDEDVRGIGFRKLLFTTRDNNKLTEERRFEL